MGKPDVRPLASHRSDRPPVSRLDRVVVVAAAAVLGAGLIVSGNPESRLSANPWSRLLTIESIVERHTLAITAAPLRHKTIDQIKVGDDYYASHPPVLPAIGAAVYWPLYKSGYRLTPRYLDEQSYAHARIVLFWLTWVVVGWSLAGGLYAFRSSLDALARPRLEVNLLAAACFAGSLLLTYLPTFNNHTVAAALVAGVWCVLIARRTDGKSTPGRLAGLGLMAALAAAIDVPTGGAMAVALMIYLKLTGATWRQLGWCLLGAAGPAALHGYLQMQVTPSPLPPQVYQQYYDYPGSHWLQPRGFDANVEPVLPYAGRLLVGPRGWLTLTPMAAWGVAYMYGCALHPGSRWKAEARLLGSVVPVVIAFYALFHVHQNYSGLCWGVRWFIAFTPPVLFFTCAAYGRLRAAWAKALFWATVSVSVIYAAVGTATPWAAVEESHQPVIRLLQHLTLIPM